MKYFLILMFAYSSFTLFSQDFPVMLDIKSELEIPVDFRDGIEESLTKMGYSLVDKAAQKEALKENAEARKSDCYDDECLVDTGKMLAAKALLSVEVTKKPDNSYKFKGRFIDFETGTTTKTKVLYYDKELSNFKTLFRFGNHFSSTLVDKKVDKQHVLPYANDGKSETKKLSLNSRYKGKWDITIGLQGISHLYNTNYEVVNTNSSSVDFDKSDDELTNGTLLGAGIDLGLNFRVNHWLGFYFNGRIIIATGDGDYKVTGDLKNSIPYTKEETVSSAIGTIGTQFSFGDTQGKGLVYYLKLGVSFGLDSYSDYEQINTLGVSGELGLNIMLSSDNFIDVYLGVDYLDYQSSTYEGRETEEYDKESDLYRTFFGASATNLVLGIRYNLFTF